MRLELNQARRQSVKWAMPSSSPPSADVLEGADLPVPLKSTNLLLYCFGAVSDRLKIIVSNSKYCCKIQNFFESELRVESTP